MTLLSWRPSAGLFDATIVVLNHGKQLCADRAYWAGPAAMVAYDGPKFGEVGVGVALVAASACLTQDCDRAFYCCLSYAALRRKSLS